MGIYLPNMEMPKEGSWTTVRIYPDGTCAVPNWQGDCTLIKDTKAVPVQPHGRLIDADKQDAQIEALIERHLHGYTKSTWDFVCELRDILKRNRTIIPADLEKEGE